MTAVMNVSIVFGWGVVVGYFLAYRVVWHYKRQPIRVESMKFGSLKLNEDETEKVLLILRDAAQRSVRGK